MYNTQFIAITRIQDQISTEHKKQGSPCNSLLQARKVNHMGSFLILGDSQYTIYKNKYYEVAYFLNEFPYMLLYGKVQHRQPQIITGRYHQP